MMTAAEGFTALFRSSPFLDRTGAFLPEGQTPVGRTLAFANVYLLVGDSRIVRASGVFAASQTQNQ